MIAALVLAGCTWDPPLPIRPPEPPATAIEGGRTNVVLVLLDTVRADHMGTYGYPLPTSPKMDALAARGVVFEQHIANSSWTRPSMGSLLTGRYARTLGLYEERFDALSGEFDLLSERFQRQGYTTLGVTSNPNLNSVFGFVKGWTAYGESGVVFRWMDTSGSVFNKQNPMEDAAVMTDRALAMLDAHGAKIDQEPFFLQVVYIDPHWPYVQPEEHLKAVKGSKKPGYDGGIHFIDAELARLFEGMEERGLMGDTLVVLTGDHGEGLKDHRTPNSDWHGNTLYESVLHVPLIATHPAIPPHRVSGLTEGIDLVPTLLDLMGWPVPSDLPGKSLAQAVRGEGPAPPDRMVFSETDFRENLKVSARTQTHKLIRNDDVIRYRGGIHEGLELEVEVERGLKATPPIELYAMGSVIERPGKTEVVEAAVSKRLQEEIKAWEKAFPSAPPLQHDPEDTLVLKDGTVVKSGGEAPVLDEATKAALKALGYLDD